MRSAYYIYNNEAVTLGAIVAVLKVKPYIDIAEIAVMLPILLDDQMVASLNERNFSGLDQMMTLNTLQLSNFNERYSNILPLMINAMSLLLDMNAIALNGKMVEKRSFVAIQVSLEDNKSDRLKNIIKAAGKLCTVTNNISVANMYVILNIKV